MIRRQLRLEVLEDRTLPALFAIPWAEASNLTLSFAPNGTQGAADTSQLYSVLGASMSQQSRRSGNW